MLSHDIKKMKNVRIKRALISVSDKTGILTLAKQLLNHQVEIISTGGTASHLRSSGLPVTDVTDLTGFPECLGGRVKTLHPRIHGALLARPGLHEHSETLRELNIIPFQLLIVNLYPFVESISIKPDDLENAIENIDIGGPAMIRAASKNFENIAVLTKPDQYADFLEELDRSNGTISAKTRFSLSASAFKLTSGYDKAIADYMESDFQIGNNRQVSNPVEDNPGKELIIREPMYQSLRYGENPHQKAAVYGDPSLFFECFHGKELSYNNYLDIDAALQFGADFPDINGTLCAIFKHNLPCGAAVAENALEAWKKAFATDTVSPFGGIIMFNGIVDKSAAEGFDSIFSEIVLAPGFSDQALEILKKKTNRRLIRIHQWPDKPGTNIRSVTGGILWQQTDTGFSEESRQIVTKVQPDEAMMNVLEFAWIIAKHVKSNGIVFAKDMSTLGIGTGQPSRVDSSRIAAQKASLFGHSLDNSVVASDAFFPFADGLEEVARAGASAVIQPGGSVRDAEVIEKADQLGISMVFTGCRHFRH